MKQLAIRTMGVLAIGAMLATGFGAMLAPANAQNAPITVIARGLTTPGGFTWNANDVLFVALAGKLALVVLLPPAAGADVNRRMPGRPSKLETPEG